MINDTARLMNDLEVVVSTLTPDVDMRKLKIRLEEVTSNYDIHRKSDKDKENDLREKVEMFIAAKRIEGLSENSIKNYKLELRMFAEKVNKPTVLITTSDIRSFLASNDKWLPRTIDRKLSVLKSFFGWLVSEELLLRNPTLRIKSPRLPKRIPKGLSVEELEIVRESCKTKRERALVEVMYSTGCRLSEVANMKISDVNIQQMNAKVIGKGDKERTVYLSFKCLHHLKSYLKSRSDDCGYLFVTERKPFRKMSNRAIQREVDKIESRAMLSKKLTPHVFRHTAATLMMENGADLADVQHILGHDKPETTLVYAHVSEERKKQAHKRYHAQ